MSPPSSRRAASTKVQTDDSKEQSNIQQIGSEEAKEELDLSSLRCPCGRPARTPTFFTPSSLNSQDKLQQTTFSNLIHKKGTEEFKAPLLKPTNDTVKIQTPSTFQDSKFSHERCDTMIADLRERLLEAHQDHETKLKQQFEYLESVRNDDVKRCKEKFDFINDRQEADIKELKGTITKLEGALDRKEKQWLEMFNEVYNLSKKPGFHNDLKAKLEIISTSLKQSQRGSEEDNSLDGNMSDDNQPQFDTTDEQIIQDVSYVPPPKIQSSDEETMPRFAFDPNELSNMRQYFDYSVYSSITKPAIVPTKKSAPNIPHKSFGVVEPNQESGRNLTELVQLKNLADLKRNEILQCKQCHQQFTLLERWFEHAKSSNHATVDIYSVDTKKYIRTFADSSSLHRKKRSLAPEKITRKRAKLFTQEENPAQLDQTKVLLRTLGPRKPKAQRKRSKKRTAKKSAQEKKKDDQYHQKLLEKFLKVIKRKLVTVEELYSELEQRHAADKFQIISPLFCDGLSVSSIVFPTMAEFESFFAERGIHIYLAMRSWIKKEELVAQNQGLTPKRYFVRIKDENATITPEFMTNLANAMNGLRDKAREIKIAQKTTELGKLNKHHLKVIDKEVSTIFIKKIDDTKDMRGCLYTENVSDTIKAICALLQYAPADTHKSSRSCLQFEPLTRKFDELLSVPQRHKFYCKDLHFLQSVSNNKRISLGLKPLLKSRVLREHLAKCNDTAMSRSEHTATFKSVEEQQAFLRHPYIVERLNQLHDEAIQTINDSPLLQTINCKISRNELWQMFFKCIDKTILIKVGKYVAVLYAYKKEYKKYVGLFGISPLSLKCLAAKYGAPGSQCLQYTLIDEESYSKKDNLKTSSHWQPPVYPFSWNNVDLNLFKEISVDTAALGWKSSVKTEDCQFKDQGLKHVFPNKEKEAEMLTKQAEDIEAEYSKHKAAIMDASQMKEVNSINGIKHVNGKLVLFDMSANIKFQASQYTSEKFSFLEAVLNKQKHYLIEGMYIFLEALNYIKVQALLKEASESHYKYLVLKDFQKAKAKEETTQRRKYKKPQEEKSVEEIASGKKASKCEITSSTEIKKCKVKQLDSDAVTTQQIIEQPADIRPNQGHEAPSTQQTIHTNVSTVFADKKDRKGRWKFLQLQGFEMCRFVANKMGPNPEYICEHCQRVVSKIQGKYLLLPV